jgi:hypothetical protein
MGYGIGAGKLLCVAVLCLFFVGVTRANDHYVAPNGKPTGDGSITNPWDLQTALNQPSSVQPGDTIWLRGGVYQTPNQGGFASYLNGTAASPIVVRNYNGERATLDGQLESMALYAGGSYTWFWGLEIMSSCTVRNTGQTYGWCSLGVGAYGPNDKFINLIVHDTQQGFSAFNAAPDNEFYGNLSYYNGFTGSDRNHGHGMYMQNITGAKTVSENMVWDNADEGIQIYGSGSADLVNFVLTGNVLFDNGSWPTPNYQYNLIIAGGLTRKNITVQNNFSYFPAGANAEGWAGSFGQYTLGQDMTVINNVFANGLIPVVFTDETGPVVFTGNTVVGATDALRPITLDVWSGQGFSYTWDNNTYYDQSPDHFFEGFATDGSSFSGVNRSFSSWQAQTGFDAHSTYSQNAPTGVWTYVRPNKYEAKRANVMIFDWDQLPTVYVDLSGVLSPGDAYVIRDAQNFYGPVVESGVYSGNPVGIAMTGLTRATPIGFPAPAHTAPHFGTFIVMSSATALPDTTPPTVSISSPASGSTVSGAVSVAATASDNVAVASVQFTLDGTSLGSAVTAAPYIANWNTIAGLDGSHTLTATARDTAGNTASSSVTVTVNNGANISVTVSPGGASLGNGQTKAFTASVASSTNQAVTWSINPSVGSISSSGVYTAPASIASAQTVTVTATSSANPAKTGTATITLTPPAASASNPGGAVATFLKMDATTQGNWQTSYGADGYSITPQSQSLPPYAGFSVSNQQNWTWASSTSDQRALQNVTGAGRTAATWYNNYSTFTLDVNSSDSNPHQVSIYAVDWDSRSRAETIQVVDAATGTVLDSRSISSFVNGVYLVWNITGHVKFNVIKSSGDNSVISGVFWGGANSSQVAIGNTGAFTGTDTTTQGNWPGVYGLDGFWIPDTTTNNVPSYVALNPQNEANWTWTSSGTEVRDLQVAGTSAANARQASCWYTYPAPTFTVDLNFTDGLYHSFEAYVLDYDYKGRSETLQVVDAITGAVLDTRQAANFTQGVYYKWTLSGHVKIKVTLTGGPNGVIGGIFFN